MSDVTGTCLCGTVKLQVTGRPADVVTCFCTHCRKVSGSTNSFNWVVPTSQLSVDSGSVSLSSVDVITDAGNTMTGFFCPGCGTTLYRQSAGIRGVAFVKAGIFDNDVVASIEPSTEIYTKNRPGWMCALEGTVQKREG